MVMGSHADVAEVGDLPVKTGAHGIGEFTFARINIRR
jgi:hypothetical protein